MRPMRSLGRPSMNLETTDLTTAMRLTRWLSTEKSSACIEPETSSPRTMSMPFTVTSVRLWVRCGRASATIMRAAATIGSNQTIPPIRLRVRRATSLARLISEYSTAATGPVDPSTESRVAARPMPRTTRDEETGSCDGWLAGLQHETSGALEKRFHVRDRQGRSGEFDEVAPLQELRQQRAVTRKCVIRALQQSL